LSPTVALFDHVDHIVAGVFGQAFFQKGCDQADHIVAGVFGQAFFEKACST